MIERVRGLKATNRGPPRSSQLTVTVAPARVRSHASSRRRSGTLSSSVWTTSPDLQRWVGTSHGEPGNARFCSQVLSSLLVERPGRYQRWDWMHDVGSEWYDVPVGATVVVEGVSSTKRELSCSWDLTIWVETLEAGCLRRGIERDGEVMRYMWEKVWMLEENSYLSAERPQECVDLVVSGNDDPVTLKGTPSRFR